MNSETRLIDLTVGELEAFLEGFAGRLAKDAAPQREPLPRYVYGLGGIAELYNCSTNTALRIKKSGKLDGAITQIGRKIVVNVDKALSLYPL